MGTFKLFGSPKYEPFPLSCLSLDNRLIDCREAGLPSPITGDWLGYYDYLGGTDLTSSVTARIEDDGTHPSGEKTELDGRGGSAPSRASIVGVRESNKVKFTSFGTPHSVAFNSVDFVGTISKDGNTINGTWAFQIFDGPFEMHRVEVCKDPSLARSSMFCE